MVVTIVLGVCHSSSCRDLKLIMLQVELTSVKTRTLISRMDVMRMASGELPDGSDDYGAWLEISSHLALLLVGHAWFNCDSCPRLRVSIAICSGPKAMCQTGAQEEHGP